MISSRTPEGEPSRCAVCGHQADVEPSSFPVRDATCPHCGSRLVFSALPPVPDRWHVGIVSEIYDPILRDLIRRVSERIGPITPEMVKRVERLESEERTILCEAVSGNPGSPEDFLRHVELLGRLTSVDG